MKPRRLTLWCPQFDNRHGGIQQFSRLVDGGLRSIRDVESCRTLALSAGMAGKASFILRAAIDAVKRRERKQRAGPRVAGYNVPGLAGP